MFKRIIVAFILVIEASLYLIWFFMLVCCYGCIIVLVIVGICTDIQYYYDIAGIFITTILLIYLEYKNIYDTIIFVKLSIIEWNSEKEEKVELQWKDVYFVLYKLNLTTIYIIVSKSPIYLTIILIVILVFTSLR